MTAQLSVCIHIPVFTLHKINKRDWPCALSSIRKGDVEDSACQYVWCRNRRHQFHGTRCRKHTSSTRADFSRPWFCCCRAKLTSATARLVCAWTYYDDDDDERMHFFLTSSSLPHRLHTMQPHSSPPCLPWRRSVAAECWATSASTCSRGPVGIPSQQARCPDSIRSEEWAHVLHEVCALPHLLCTFFYASVTNICPLVSQRPHLLRRFCSTDKIIMKETRASLAESIFLMRKSKVWVLILVKNEARWVRLRLRWVFFWVTVGSQLAWTPTQLCSVFLILLFIKRQECMKWSDQVLSSSLFSHRE